MLKAGLRHLVRFLLQRGFFDFKLHDAAALFIKFLRHAVHLCADHGAGFINQVDGLVRQKPVADIAMGQLSGRNQRRVLYFDAVKDLIAFTQTAKNGNGILHRRLLYQHRLKAALQCRILFNVLAVFVKRRRAYAVQFSPGEHGLQQVARIHASLGFPRAHNGVQLIDKQKDASG